MNMAMRHLMVTKIVHTYNNRVRVEISDPARTYMGGPLKVTEIEMLTKEAAGLIVGGVYEVRITLESLEPVSS